MAESHGSDDEICEVRPRLRITRYEKRLLEKASRSLDPGPTGERGIGQAVAELLRVAWHYLSRLQDGEDNPTEQDYLAQGLSIVDRKPNIRVITKHQDGSQTSAFDPKEKADGSS